MNAIIPAISWIVIYVGIPCWFIVFPAFAEKFHFIPARTIGRGVMLATLVMWPLMAIHPITIEAPYNKMRFNDLTDDGVGGNAAMLVMGWALALFLQAPHVVLRLMIEFIKNQKRMD